MVVFTQRAPEMRRRAWLIDRFNKALLDKGMSGSYWGPGRVTEKNGWAKQKKGDKIKIKLNGKNKKHKLLCFGNAAVRENPDSTEQKATFGILLWQKLDLRARTDLSRVRHRNVGKTSLLAQTGGNYVDEGWEVTGGTGPESGGYS